MNPNRSYFDSALIQDAIRERVIDISVPLMGEGNGCVMRLFFMDVIKLILRFLTMNF